MFGDHITLLQSLQITFIAMTVVFIVLYIISLVLSGLSYVFKEKGADGKNTNKKDVAKESLNSSGNKKSNINLSDLTEDKDKLVAAIVATMEAAGENKNSNFKITNIRQL